MNHLKRLLNFLYCFIGTNRTGKSSVAVYMALQWKINNPGQLVIAHDPQDNFTDIADIFIQPEDSDWAIKLCEYRNCLIILDDYRLINEGDRPVKGLMKLLYFRAKWNIDIIVITHNPSLVINAIAQFTSHYFIFMTNAQEGSFKKKISNYSFCVAGSEIVNKYVSINGRGKYPIFPFVIVDCERQKLVAMNLDSNASKNNMDDKLKNVLEEGPLAISDGGGSTISPGLKLLNQKPKQLGIGLSNNLKK